MNAIEKAKEALKKALDAIEYLDDDGFESHKAVINDALTALEAEKPADDATKLAQRIYRDGGCRVMLSFGYYGSLIQSYAEAYHAKKCAECRKQAAEAV